MNVPRCFILSLLIQTIVVLCGQLALAEKPQILISFAHASPDTAFLRRHIDWMERRPLDGVAFGIPLRDAAWITDSQWEEQIRGLQKAGNVDWPEIMARPRDLGLLSLSSTLTGEFCSPWSPANKYDEKTISPALLDLQATKFERFKNNFLAIWLISSQPTDWFNDEQWKQRCHNFAMLARFAKKSGAKGFFFDDEEYSNPIFNYDALRKLGVASDKSYEEHREKARQRGREFIQAICQEFPEIIFWALHGYGSMACNVEQGLPEMRRRLSSPFYDGMLEGASEQFVFVDGGEIAYGFSTKEHFEHGRKMILEEPIRMGLTQVPDLFRKKVRCGFGVWPEHYGALYPADPEKSYFSPGRLQRALYWAHQYSDGYVWVYGEEWTWWTEGPGDRAPVDMYNVQPSKPEPRVQGFPQAYWKAVEAARTSPGSDTSPTPSAPHAMPTRGRARCVDGVELTEFLSKTEQVFELPVKGWTFKLDDWGSQTDDPATFKPITIGTPWDQQGFTGKDSMGWYRLEFTPPANLRGRQLDLHFPDVDGSVWLNGTTLDRGMQTVAWRYVDLEPESLRKPFVLQTSVAWMDGLLRPGEPMVLVLKVQGYNGTGGILSPVKVLAKK